MKRGNEEMWKELGRGIRRSLRADEMDGSISQPEISGVKDKTAGGGRENTLCSQISLQRKRKVT